MRVRLTTLVAAITAVTFAAGCTGTGSPAPQSTQAGRDNITHTVDDLKVVCRPGYDPAAALPADKSKADTETKQALQDAGFVFNGMGEVQPEDSKKSITWEAWQNACIIVRFTTAQWGTAMYYESVAISSGSASTLDNSMACSPPQGEAVTLGGMLNVLLSAVDAPPGALVPASSQPSPSVTRYNADVIVDNSRTVTTVCTVSK